MQDDKTDRPRPYATLASAMDEADVDAMVNALKGEEAVLHYDTPDYTIIRAGSFVRCAVTGKPISLAKLRYWSPELQEAYIDAQTATQRWRDVQGHIAERKGDDG